MCSTRFTAFLHGFTHAFTGGFHIAADSVFRRLQAAGRRLLAVIDKNRGGANKELARFADQINDLCNKWDR